MAGFTGFITLGKITVPSPGTPVPILVEATTGFQVQTVIGLIIQALSGNSGKIYIGDSTLNKSTLAGCIKVLPAPSSALIPDLSVFPGDTVGPAFNLSTIFIDADNAGEGVIASGIVG